MQARKEIAFKRITNDMKTIDPMKFIEESMKSIDYDGKFLVAWFGKKGAMVFRPWMDPYSKYIIMIKQMKEEENEAKEKEHQLERK